MAECKGQVSQVINAPPEKVWTYVGDLMRHAEWNHQPQRIEMTSPPPSGVGSTYHADEKMPDAPLPMKIMMMVVMRPIMLLSGANKGTEATVTEIDAPKRIAWEAHAPKRKGDMMRARWAINLVPEGAGTRVTQDFEFMPPSRFPGAPPVKLVTDEVTKNLQSLKELAERG